MAPSDQDERISLFTLDVIDNEIVDVSGRGDFDLHTYGRLKYCDSTAAEYYGTQLAHLLMQHKCPHQLDDFYIAASGFKHVPSAAHSLLSPMIATLALHHNAPSGLFRVDRGIVKAVDYSTLSAEERALSNSDRRVSLPDVSAYDIFARHIVVVDDIYVSGKTEEETRRSLMLAHPAGVLYVYVATLNGTIGQADASIEHRLTHAAVKCLDDLVPIVESSAFVLNARTCKFILRATSPDEVRSFVRKIPPHRANQILSGMIADGYHKMPSHHENFTAFVDAMHHQNTPQPAKA